jgi:hypothetical protein
MKIDKICEEYKIKNYTINPDGSIDVDGYVDLYRCRLDQLPLVFNKVTGWFDCSHNRLTSLKGSPKWVGSDFYCSGNYLTSLEFSPDYVGGFFHCGYSEKLTNPKGCTEKIGQKFTCNNTPLSSIFNGVDQFFLHAFNFYKIIKDDTVNLKRLKYVMDLYDQPIDLEKIEKYYRIV